MNWPLINFLDPAPPPQSVFDEYLSDSEEEEEGDEDKGARKSIAEGFYGRKSRNARSSAPPIPGNSNFRRLCVHKLAFGL